MIGGLVMLSAGVVACAWQLGREYGQGEGRAEAEARTRALALESLRNVADAGAELPGLDPRSRASGAWQVARAFLEAGR